jgi:DNA-binding NarL/FixJ family response regulator
VPVGRTVEGQVQPTGLRVLVAARSWWTREAVLRVLERRGLHPVDADDRADVAVVDVDDADGPARLAELRSRDVPAVALSDGRGQVVGALAQSASYAVKGELDPERLAHLVCLAASRAALFVQAGREPLRRLGETPVERYALTPRELDVLRCLALGRTNAEIAAELHLAPSSVKKLVSRCLARLGVRNRVEAALLVQREGVLSEHVY